jgi:hypothetical protein
MTRFLFETPPYGGPSISTPPIFVFEAANFPRELENEKNWYSKLYSFTSYIEKNNPLFLKL